MTIADFQNKTPVTANTSPAAAPKVSLLFSSWTPPVDTPGVKYKFDPKEAGRRAASKHADALRRLST